MRALIFDLDSCLAAADEPGQQLFEPVFEAIRTANHGTVPDAELQSAFQNFWRHALDWVARRHGFSEEMLQAGWNAMLGIEVSSPMYGYGDLHFLGELPGDRFLVTSGFRRLQESKVRALGIAPLFEAIYVDAIEEPDRKGKEGIFKEILQQNGYRAGEVLVIGDNPESELAVARRLGIRTVQTLRPGVGRDDSASYHVHGLAELKTLLESID